MFFYFFLKIHKFQSTLPVRGATVSQYNNKNNINKFQSTLPVRGATGILSLSIIFINISIHAPRAGSDKNDFTLHQHFSISIHAPRAGSDNDINLQKINFVNFNPRSPCGERPENRLNLYRWAENFNPRSPCGERPRATIRLPVSAVFQSTLPVRGATFTERLQIDNMEISIHAPRAGSDPKWLDLITSSL